MTTDEGFLRRWSRRKRAAKAAETAELGAPSPALPPEIPEPERAGEPSAVQEAVPDAGSAIAPETVQESELPLVESLTAASDFTVFLQKGVSAAMQSRALRVAWESDERIAGFRGMAEYAWDFNAPGYGKLWATDDVAKMVREALKGALPPEPEPASEDAPSPEEVSPEQPAVAIAQAPGDPVSLDPVAAITENSVEPPAVAASPEAEASAPQEVVARDGGIRRHGSALPS